MSLVTVQNIVFPKQDICDKTNLYFRQIGFPAVPITNYDKIKFVRNQRVSFDTYFNSFSLLKWHTYAYVNNLFLCITLKGKFRVNLIHMYLSDGGIVNYKIIETYKVDTDIKKTFLFEYVTDNPFGCVSFSLECLETDSTFFEASYCSNIEEDKISPVKLGIGICTFKRESYVNRNIANLLLDIINNSASELYNKLEVFISDNAGTLDGFDNEHIHLVQNKNTGGSGGFTRCMIEALHYNDSSTEKLTHLIMMDDDVKFDTTSILRTYKLLSIIKPEYRDTFIGGAMFKMDKQNIQHASGEYWHGDRCESFVETFNNNRDMESIIHILENENFTKANYQAWWFCAIPMTTIAYDNLSMPFFIKSDDIEYSIRNLKHLILLNGINVWHESFESKYSAQNEYYTVRNYLVSASIHNQAITKERVLSFFTNYVKHYICNYKYLEIEHFCNAINDYLGGVKHLKSIDIEKYHKSILSKGYKMVDIEQLPIKFTDEQYYHDISFNPNWSRFKRKLAKYTINGLLLPAKNYAVLGMWGGTYEQTYRKKFLVRYEIQTKKGFILERNLGKALKMLQLYRKTKRNIKKKFDWAYNDFNQNWHELPTYENWNNQLELK